MGGLRWYLNRNLLHLQCLHKTLYIILLSLSDTHTHTHTHTLWFSFLLPLLNCDFQKAGAVAS